MHIRIVLKYAIRGEGRTLGKRNATYLKGVGETSMHRVVEERKLEKTGLMFWGSVGWGGGVGSGDGCQEIS